nr:hypothetical protein [Tanacetum cinerariifolium]
MNTASSSGTGLLPSSTIPNPREDLKAITTQSGVTLAGPLISPHPISKEVDREPKIITDQMPEVTKDTVQPSTKNIQSSMAQIPIYEPVVSPKPKPTIPYPSRVNKQKLHEKDDNLALKFVEICTGSLPSSTIPNPREDLKAITTRSGVTLAGPLISPHPISKEVDREPKTITDQVLTGSTNNVPPLAVELSPTSTSFST